MANGNGKKDKCSIKFKEACERRGKVAHYNEKENKCECKPKRSGIKDASYGPDRMEIAKKLLR